MYSWTIPLATHRVQVRSTTVDQGDFAIPRPRVEVESGHFPSDPDAAFWPHRRAIIDRPWTWLRQVHGTDIVMVRVAGEAAGATADAAITTVADAPIAVTTADCSPVVLVSTVGVAVVHAGWRGALDGIIEAAGEQLLAEGGTPVFSILGPCIGVANYAFGDGDLERVAACYGDAVRGVTASGTPALDMAVVVGAACERAGWAAPAPTACTSEASFFSHRVRGETGRQTTVAWLEAMEQ